MATLQEDKMIMFRNRLNKLFRHRGRQAKRLNITCYRVYDHDLPEFPLCIELYGEKIYVAEYKRKHGMGEEEHAHWVSDSLKIISEVFAIPVNDIFLKLRQRKPGREGQYQKNEQQVHDFIVDEAGLKFIVNLVNYLDSGLFLDHRITRQMVRSESSYKKVLNLFAYTGSFSVNAAAGDAIEVVTVDLSKTYLDRARRNMELNGFNDPQRFKYVQADAREFIRTVPGNYFDLVILDPPTFSNSKRMEGFLDIQRDHVEMINGCLAGMGNDGVLYFSTNYSRFILNESLINGSIKDITKSTTPFDFEGALCRYCFRIEKGHK